MIITQAIRNCLPQEVEKQIDYLFIAWYQTSKRIQRLTTADGQAIAIRFLGKNQRLSEGDILYEDESKVIMVSILPCEALVVATDHWIQLSWLAYEIGNKHVPLFVKGTDLYMPYERPMQDWLTSKGYQPKVEQKKLSNPLNANVDYEQHKKISFKLPQGGLVLKI